MTSLQPPPPPPIRPPLQTEAVPKRQQNKTKMIQSIILAFLGTSLLLTSFSSPSSTARYLRQTIRRQLQFEAPPPINSYNLSATNPAIATLITSETNITSLCLAFQTLVRATAYPSAPIVAFDDVGLTPDLIDTLTGCTASRPLSFDPIDLQTTMPAEVNTTEIQSSWSADMGFIKSDWTANHASRFWTHGIWTHPAIDAHDVIMRIEDDYCLSHESAHLPDFQDPDHHYHAEKPADRVEINGKYTTGLVALAEQYMASQSPPLTPANPTMWNEIVTTNTLIPGVQVPTLPIYNTEWELCRKSFFQRPEVLGWLDAVANGAPHGMYRHGWRTNHERYLTAAMFLTEAEMGDYAQHPAEGVLLKNPLDGRWDATRHTSVCTV